MSYREASPDVDLAQACLPRRISSRKERAVAKLFYAVRQVAELAGAASTAAAYKLGFKNLKTVVMLTGSNIQPSQLAEILSKHT